MRRLNPTTIALILLGALLLLVVGLFVLRGGNSDQDKLADNETAAASDAGPEERCASQRTYDAIKLELFRQAAQVRGSDQSAFDRLAAYAAVRMEQPVLRSHDEDLGTIRCAGNVVLDLPPGVAVVGGRRSLSAKIEYVLQTAADGSGDVIMLDGVDPIVVPLATLARTSGQPALTAPPDANAVAPADQGAQGGGPVAEPAGPTPPATEPPSPEPEPAPQPTARANPSFNCANARTRGEVAVCNDPGLARLDRQMAAQFNGAMADATPAQRALLQRTRRAFLGYRDRCPNEACIAETYRGRMREIRDIMAGRWRPER